MHYMHYKDYIHHGLAAEKTTPPLPQGGEPSGWVGGGVGVPAHIYIYIQTLFSETWISPVASVRAILHLSFFGSYLLQFLTGLKDLDHLGSGPGDARWAQRETGGFHSSEQQQNQFFFLFSCEFLQHRFFGIFLGSIFEGNAIAKTQRKLCWSPSIWFRFTRLGP